MRLILSITISMFLFACKNDEKQIIKVFNDFNNANIQLNGARLYELSDKKSHLYYKDLLTNILEMDSISVSNLNLGDKINLLSARSVIHDSLLKKMNAKELMIKMYTEVNTMDSVKINLTKKMGIKNIKVDGLKAYSNLAINDKTLSPKVNISFYKEDGEWKYSILSIADFAEIQLKNICKQNGFSDMDFIKLVFSDPNVQAKKIKRLDEIWNPIKK